MHDDHPAAEFLFAMNDWFKNEGMYDFIESQTTNGKRWKIDRYGDDGILVSIGNGYDWHFDGQRNLFGLSEKNEVPRMQHDILVNTLVLAVDPCDMHRAIEGPNGSLHVGSKMGENSSKYVDAGQLETYDGTLHSQGMSAQTSQYGHKAEIKGPYKGVDHPLHHLVLSFQCPIIGLKAAYQRYCSVGRANGVNAMDLMEDANDRVQNWTRNAHSASSLWEGSSIGMQVKDKRQGSLVNAGSRKKDNYPTHKMPHGKNDPSLPSAYLRCHKTIALSGEGWHHLCG